MMTVHPCSSTSWRIGAVKAPRGFIGQQELDLCAERARNGDALLFAA